MSLFEADSAVCPNEVITALLIQSFGAAIPFLQVQEGNTSRKNIKRAWFPRVQTTWRYICHLIYWVLKGTWQDRCSSPSPSEITSQEKSPLLIGSVREEEKPIRKRAVLTVGNMPGFNPTEKLDLFFNQPFLQQVRKEDFIGDWTLVDRRTGLQSNTICANASGVKAKYTISTFVTLLSSMERSRN